MQDENISAQAAAAEKAAAEKKAKRNIALGVGLGVGLGVLAVILLVLLCAWSKRKQESKPNKSEEDGMAAQMANSSQSARNEMADDQLNVSIHVDASPASPARALGASEREAGPSPTRARAHS